MLAFSDGFTSVHPCIFALPQTITSSFAKPWEKNKMKWVRRISPKVILFFHFFFFYNRPNFSAKNSDKLNKWQFGVFLQKWNTSFSLNCSLNVRYSCRNAMINILISNKSTEERCFLRHKSPQLFPWHYY